MSNFWSKNEFRGINAFVRLVPGNDITGFEDELIKGLDMQPSNIGWQTIDGLIFMVLDKSGRYKIFTYVKRFIEVIDGVIYGPKNKRSG